MDYRTLSLWHETVSGALTPRAGLSGDAAVDVAIVGAGFTGLWTAYYLQAADPNRRITIIESEIAGFGASGRNGGWCSALFPVSASTLAAEFGAEAATEQYRAMRAAVGEVVRVADRESIDADVALGGTVVLARSPAQLARADADVDESVDYGLEVDLLNAEDAAGRVAATAVLGGTFTPHCAAIHPAKLVRGLADVVERRGARIVERTRAVAIGDHQVTTDAGVVTADVIVRATEGYTARLTGHRRTLAPVYSLIIATEPLSDSIWSEIGLRDRQTFSDYRHLIVYGQRSTDGRLIFGGRGAPYHFGSRIDPTFDRVPDVFAALRQSLVELFPVLAGARITHAWGGPLGIARDWHPSVGFDGALAWAGGYVGDGVSTANLAGRTLADLIDRRETDITGLPWVGHRSRRWEPEPLRWLGANAGLLAMRWADRTERHSDRGSRVARLAERVIGR